MVVTGILAVVARGELVALGDLVPVLSRVNGGQSARVRHCSEDFYGWLAPGKLGRSPFVPSGSAVQHRHALAQAGLPRIGRYLVLILLRCSAACPGVLRRVVTNRANSSGAKGARDPFSTRRR